MNIFNVENLTIDGKFMKKISNTFKELLKQPPALIFSVVAMTLITSGYFFVNYFNHKAEVKELSEKVLEIDNKIDDALDITDYQKNLLYTITEIKLLEQEINENYKEKIYEIDCLEKFIQHHHPNDPIIVEFESMKSRMTMSYEMYNQHYKVIMKELDNIVDNKNEINN